MTTGPNNRSNQNDSRHAVEMQGIVVVVELSVLSA
ncbi:hypothetical protein PF008_g17077 [Phytophthora fragariae]|uniref:Uncharacterized protein n=1 Tax=Phytophthora fragariae TaxID=53985 RepID=A0A6G0RAI2_9STRA|nr:hypothetical protein PF008_g17077 [Phytophthora fragariae]